MTDPEQDEEFEAFLKRRTVLPNAMSADDKLEPPSALDDIVLKKAREAIKARQQPQQVRAPRWAVPLALAATILLCLAVVMNVSLNVNRPTANLQHMARESTANTPQSPASIVEPAPRASEPAADAAAQSEAAVSANHRSDASAGMAAALPPPDATAPALARANGAAAANAKKAVTAPAPARESGKYESVYGGVEAPLQEAVVTRSPASPAVRPRVATEVAPVPPPSAAPDATLELKPRLAKVTAHPQDPDVWLRQIEALRAQGKTAQADAEMRRFRAAFPTYPTKPAVPVPAEAPPAASGSAPASSEQPK